MCECYIENAIIIVLVIMASSIRIVGEAEPYSNDELFRESSSGGRSLHDDCCRFYREVMGLVTPLNDSTQPTVDEISAAIEKACDDADPGAAHEAHVYLQFMQCMEVCSVSHVTHSMMLFTIAAHRPLGRSPSDCSSLGRSSIGRPLQLHRSIALRVANSS